MGLDCYLVKGTSVSESYESWIERKVELDSKLFPDHMFKIGYWRSSYNESGIDSVLASFSMPSLWHLYADEHGEIFSWNERALRARNMLAEFKRTVELASGVRLLSMRDYGFFDSSSPDEPGQALGIYLAERARIAEHSQSFDSYGKGANNFWMGDPLSVRAIIPGRRGDDKRRTIYMVVQCEEGYYDWYIQSLMIVVETCEWVLAQDNPEQYILEYSG